MATIGNLVVSIIGDNKKLDKALKGSQKQIQSFTKLGMAAGVMIGNLAAKGIAYLAKASIQAVKKLGRFTKELVVIGQKSLSLRKSFESLTKSFGANSKEILKSMSKAAKGTIADMKLMQLANQAMLLGLKPELFAEMVEIARRTAKATGQDINYLFESIVTGLGRQSKMILDNLGIVFDASTAYEWYAKSLGKTASQLTETEKKLGWQSYALEVARENVKRLGDDTLTLTEIGSIFSTTWDNLKALIGEKLVKAINDVVKEFGGWEVIIARVQKFVDDKVVLAFDNLILRLKEFGIKVSEAEYSEFIKSLKGLGKSLGNLAKAFTDFGDMLDESKSDWQGFIDFLIIVNNTIAFIINSVNIAAALIKAVFSSIGVIIGQISIAAKAFIGAQREGETFAERVKSSFVAASIALDITQDECDEALEGIWNKFDETINEILDKDIPPPKIEMEHNFDEVFREHIDLRKNLPNIDRTVTYAFKTTGFPTGAGWTGLTRYQFGGIIPSTQAILAHRGEMLLTPRDQRNLFNLLQRPTSQSTTYSTPIHIENLAVREEADIYRIAEELHEKQLIEQRGGGNK